MIMKLLVLVLINFFIGGIEEKGGRLMEIRRKNKNYRKRIKYTR
jgi:hypothetical protein